MLDEAEHHVADQRAVELGPEEPRLDAFGIGLDDRPRSLAHDRIRPGLDEVPVGLEREQRDRRVERIALVELQVGLDRGAELLAGIVDVVAELLEALQLAPGVELGDREQHLLLRLEVLVERRLRDPGGRADGGDGGGLETLLAEQLQGRLEDSLLPLGVAATAVSGGGFGGPAFPPGYRGVEIRSGPIHRVTPFIWPYYGKMTRCQ